MSVMFVLVPTALVLVLVAVGGYVWAAKRGQFDDLDTPAIRALHDDEPAVPVREGGPPAKNPPRG